MNTEQDVTKVAEALGGSAALGRHIEEWDDLLQVARSGMPAVVLGKLSSRMSVDSGCDLAVHLLELMRGVEENVRLTQAAGLSAIRIANLFVMLLESFGDESSASRFFTTPHPELGGEMPIAVAVSNVDAVEEVIMRGNYGLPA